MFKFLKGLFKPEETEETVETDKLLFWFDNKIKERLKGVDKEIDLFFQGIESRKRILAERMDALEKAEVKEPDKIEEKIKNIVLGNRENYVRALKIFLDSLVVPKEKVLKGAFSFNQTLKEKLDELAKTTGKSFSVTQHLFFNEIDQIAKGLKDLNDISKGFDVLVEKKKVKDIEMIRKIIDLLYEKIKEKEKLNLELKEKKEKFERVKLLKGDKSGEIKKLEQSPEFMIYQELKNRKDSMDNDVKQNLSSFLQVFAQLERSVRKYEHAALENIDLIKSYLENPIETFLKDKELIFLKILQGVKKNLQREDIGLKDSKREKTLDVIEDLDGVWLRNIQNKHKDLAEEKKILVKKIDNNFIQGKLSDAKYKLEHFDVQIADLEQEIKEKEEYFEKADLEKIKEGLKKKVLEVFRVKLSFELPSASV